MSETQQKHPKTKTRRKRSIFLIILFVFVVLIASLFLIPVDFEIKGYGNILSARDAVLRAGSKGPVRKILSESGQRVKQNQVILELEDDVEISEVDRCERQLDEAQEQLVLLRETLNIQKQKDYLESEFAQIKYQDSENEFQRISKLHSQAAASDQELRLSKVQRTLDHAEYKQKAINKDRLRAAKIAVQKRKIETLKAQLIQAKRMLARRKILAPIDGVLVMHALSIGQVVDANEVLGQIFDDRYYQVVARIGEQYAWYLKENQKATLELRAYPWWHFGYLQAKLYWVSPVVHPQASGDGTVLIKAQIENIPKEIKLKAGMASTIWIRAGKTRLIWRLLGIKSYE